MTTTLNPPRLKDIDLSLQMEDEEHYRDELKALQNRLIDQAVGVYHNDQRVVIVVEGWDAGGKGGAIRRMMEKLDPRSCRVYATGKPDEREAREHYLQRFWRRLPSQGQITIFDRSWYGRVLVERVEGYADEDAWQRAYGEINQFEKTLSDDGVLLIKLFFHISQDEQLKRYVERLKNPRKHWKLTAEDLRNRERADDYCTAYNNMFDKTHTGHAPWLVIAGEHKWYARVAAIKAVCQRIDANLDASIPRFSDEEIEEARRLLGLDD